MENLNIIVAHGHNRVIGSENDLPWAGEMREDMKRFVELTTGHTILMGRKTYDSIGRPLPNRRNIVLTSQDDLEIEGCETVNTFADVLDMEVDGDLFVIGGAKVYHLAMPHADKLYVTEIDGDFPGDTFFPELPDVWHEVYREPHGVDERNHYGYTFVEYERIT